MPPFVAAALGVLGAVALARVIVRQARRANDFLDAHRAGADGEAPVERLERDPATGEYRPVRRS